MSREDDVRKLLAAFRNMKADGTYWDVVVDAIVDAIDARIRELTHGTPVQPEATAHEPGCIGADDHMPPCPIKPEATAHKTSDNGGGPLMMSNIVSRNAACSASAVDPSGSTATRGAQGAVAPLLSQPAPVELCSAGCGFPKDMTMTTREAIAYLRNLLPDDPKATEALAVLDMLADTADELAALHVAEAAGEESK